MSELGILCFKAYFLTGIIAVIIGIIWMRLTNHNSELDAFGSGYEYVKRSVYYLP